MGFEVRASMQNLCSWYDVVRLLLDYKQGLLTPRIPIVDADGRTIGRLEILGLRHVGDEALVEQFVRWRNQNLVGWLDQRPVTKEGTAAWVAETATNPTRVAMLIYAGDKLVGRCGNINLRPWELMSDGLVRGESGGGIRFIHYAQVAGLIWTFLKLGVDTVHAKVLSTNDLSLASCRSLGYDMRPYRESRIYRKASPTGVFFEEFGEPTERVDDATLQYLQLTRDSFFRVVDSVPGFAALHAQFRNESEPAETRIS